MIQIFNYMECPMTTNEIVMTETDKQILQSMRTVTMGLGAYLGTGCEVILHSLENLQASAVEVINGHHSGRQVGAPITNLALEMLEEMERSGEKKTKTYFNVNKNGVTIKSCTIPVIGEQERIIGLICINFYSDIALGDFLSHFLPDPRRENEGPHMIESFSQNVDDLIFEAVTEIQKEIMEDDDISLNNKNKEIVVRLEEKGIFNIKDAVIQVADQLNISKNTVYMHLRNQRKRT